MYTSDKNEIIHYADEMLHDAFLFLAAGIACAAFGLIYEIFSHEVYSFYMIYAFLILLVPGALLNLVIVWRAVKKEKYLRIKEAAEHSTANAGFVENISAEARNTGRAVEEEPKEDFETRYEISNATETQVSTGVFFPGRFTRHAWNSGIATLTVGSIFKGVLDIYGTTNKMIVLYPIVAAVLICAAVTSFSMSYAAIRKMRRKAETSLV